jgi:hypothetical protein
MPLLQVLVNEKGAVVGTARLDIRAGGTGPDRVTLVAGPGQRLLEIEVNDRLTGLAPDALHAAIRKEHLKARPKKAK